jgi:hydrogenase maturation factor
MIENNEMDEVAEVPDLVVRTAGDNMKQYKMIRHIGLMASVVKEEEARETSQAFRNKNDDSRR